MKTSTRIALRVASGWVLVFMVLVGNTHPASAKGPESVTITGPGLDQPLELMTATNHDLIVQLMEQSQLWYGPVTPLSEPPAGALGPAYTLTWVNLGPPEKSVADRTIRQLIYLNAEGGPLIQTPDQASLHGWGPEVIGWFAAPAALRATLIDLGAPIPAAPAAQPPTGSSAAPALPFGMPVAVAQPIAPLALGLLIILAAALGVIWRRVKLRPSPAD